MFDLDVSKMIVVGIVALAVIPPKDLPRVMRAVGQTVGKMRRMAAEFQSQFMEAMREVERQADLDSVKQEFQAINDAAKIDASFDPVGMIRDDLTKAVEAPKEPGAAEAVASELAAPEIGESEIGESEIALTGPERADAAIAAKTRSAPDAPVARRSAAE